MTSLKFKMLHLIKEFPRWQLVNISEDDFFHLKNDFDENYRSGKYKTPPTINPLQYVIFDTRQGPFDVYDPKLIGYGGSLIVSNRLLSMLQEYNLQEYKVFPGIKYVYKGEERDDMNFMVFYKDYSQFIDYSKSTYRQVISDYTFHKDEKENLKKEAIIKDNIKFRSREEYYFNLRKIDRLSNDPKIAFKHIYCSECVKLDMFYFINEEAGIYLSPRLVKRLAEERMKGVDYWGYVTFEFTG